MHSSLELLRRRVWGLLLLLGLWLLGSDSRWRRIRRFALSRISGCSIITGSTKESSSQTRCTANGCSNTEQDEQQ
eukprot:6249631-Prymnesium_polylepis.1